MQVQEHFDKKAISYYEHYYQADNKNCHAHNQRIRRLYFRELILDYPNLHGGTALDIGSGPGSIALELLGCGFDTSCIDLSFNMLLNNRKNTGIVKLARCSADALCFKNNTFDIITAAGVLEYVRDDRSALREIWRVLKPGAPLIISVPIKHSASSYVRKLLRRIVFKEKGDLFYHKNYAIDSFRKQVGEAGFAVKTNISHHFVFFPLDHLFPKFAAQLDCFFTRFLGKSLLFARFGSTFIINATKPPNIDWSE